MRRRDLLLLPLGLAACSVLPSQPYLQKTDWPLTVRRPTALPPPRNGRVLLVRTMSAGPGLDRRGLQWLETDGSLHVDYYQQWAVPPAQAVEASSRQWLADSGLFAAVLSPGSRMSADFVLEAELTTFVADPAASVVRATVGIVLLRQHPTTTTVLLQQTEHGEAPLSSTDPAAMTEAFKGALIEVLEKVERDVAGAVAR